MPWRSFDLEEWQSDSLGLMMLPAVVFLVLVVIL